MDYSDTGIPRRFWNTTLDDFHTDHAKRNAEALQAAKDLVAAFLNETRAPGKGLLLIGPPGTGKTMLGCVVAKTMAASDSSRHLYYMTMAGYHHYLLSLMELRSAWEKMGDEDSFEKWKILDNRVRSVRNETTVLLLDDVGKEHITSTHYAEDEMDFLLRRRYDLGLASVLTSNLPLDDWASAYLAPMRSFIEEAFVIIQVETTPDYDYRIGAASNEGR